MYQLRTLIINPMSDTKVLARVRVDWNTWRKLRSLAILNGQTVEELAGQAIQRFLEEAGRHETRQKDA